MPTYSFSAVCHLTNTVSLLLPCTILILTLSYNLTLPTFFNTFYPITDQDVTELDKLTFERWKSLPAKPLHSSLLAAQLYHTQEKVNQNR